MGTWRHPPTWRPCGQNFTELPTSRTATTAIGFLSHRYPFPLGHHDGFVFRARFLRALFRSCRCQGGFWSTQRCTATSTAPLRLARDSNEARGGTTRALHLDVSMSLSISQHRCPGPRKASSPFLRGSILSCSCPSGLDLAFAGNLRGTPSQCHPIMTTNRYFGQVQNPGPQWPWAQRALILVFFLAPDPENKAGQFTKPFRGECLATFPAIS